MNRLLNASLTRIDFDKGADSVEKRAFLRIIESLRAGEYELIPVALIESASVGAGESEYKNILNYFVLTLKIFDLHFRLLLDSDDHIDLDDEKLQVALMDGGITLGSVYYSKNYVMSNVFVYLSPTKRFRRIMRGLE